MAQFLRSVAWLTCLTVLSSALKADNRIQYDVRQYGAVGDGKTIDTDAINRAIQAASHAGGGMVVFNAGTYASYSIHLESNITLYLGAGVTLLAAEPSLDGKQGYDNPELNTFNPYQDFGHSHWHNSLIWGENLQNVSIIGPGKIYGYGLSRGLSHAVRDLTPEEHEKYWTLVLKKFDKDNKGYLNHYERGILMNEIRQKTDPELLSHVLPQAMYAPKPRSFIPGAFGYPSANDTQANGVGNKAIALKNCRNVTLKDFTIYHGGHFAILAMATDNMTIDNLTIDTNRDGMDIDCCVNVRVSNCSVNSPWDDGICLKSSFALGYKRACENITITNCNVSGYLEGTLLDGTRQKRYLGSEETGATGRIKFGTESNGGYKNITVSNCTFDYCRGLALEIVDGGTMEDVTVSNLSMRDIQNSAIYIRLGERNREPHTANGVVRRINISNIVGYNIDPRFGSIIEGSPDCYIKDVSLSNIRLAFRGGGTSEEAAVIPHENLKTYPEPEFHGVMPAYGCFVRYVKNIEMHDIFFSYIKTDLRPAISLQSVTGAEFRHIKAQHAMSQPIFALHSVTSFIAKDVNDLADISKDEAKDETY